MKMSKMTPIALCLAVGISTVTVESQAARWTKKLPTTAAAPATPSHSESQNLPSAKYPNGLGWRAIELDFIEVDEAHTVINNKLDDIAEEVGEIDTTVGNIETKVDEIDIKVGNIETTVGEIDTTVGETADAVAMLKNALQVQVSVAPASADARNEVNDAPVTVYVQVIQNGTGLTGLAANAFTFSKSFPVGGVADFCGEPVCIAGFSEGQDGLYALELAGDWVAGAYAGTLAAQDSATSASGTSMVTFEIPAEPVPSP